MEGQEKSNSLAKKIQSCRRLIEPSINAITRDPKGRRGNLCAFVSLEAQESHGQ